MAGWTISDGCVAYNKSNHSTHTIITQKSDSRYLKFIKSALKSLNIHFTEYTYLNKGKDMYKKEGVKVTQICFSKCWRIPLLYGGLKRKRILDTFADHYKVTVLDKQLIYVDLESSPKRQNVWDLTTSAGSFICEGFLVHNCIERLKAFEANGAKDPIKYRRKFHEE